MSELYGIRWENGDIEPGGGRAGAQCLGGLFDNETRLVSAFGEVTLMVSRDGGATWTEDSGESDG